MKNAMKVNAILGIVTFFVPAYPMEEGALANNFSQLNYSLSEMKEEINPKHCPFYLVKKGNKLFPLPDDDPLFTEENILFSLATIKFIKSGPEKSSKLLKAIGNAVSQGERLASDYRFEVTNFGFEACGNTILIKPRSCDEKPYSILEKANEWMEETRTDVKNYNFSDVESKARVYKMVSCYEDNYNLMFETIFESEAKRRSYINNEFKQDIDDRLAIKIPQVITYLIFSLLLHDEENMALIEQAKKEFK